MTRSSIWIGIGAFALATMGTLSVDPSNGSNTLSSLSVGTPALAQLPPQIEDLLDLDTDDGPDDDGPDDGNDDGPDDGPDEGPDDDGDDDGPMTGKKG